MRGLASAAKVRCAEHGLQPAVLLGFKGQDCAVCSPSRVKCCAQQPVQKAGKLPAAAGASVPLLRRMIDGSLQVHEDIISRTEVRRALLVSSLFGVNRKTTQSDACWLEKQAMDRKQRAETRESQL
ncbi:hypothetical protein AK812_SmicGene9420 [Symbiodinium microadriaticum]|uniref:Uncharacterized protein n=1 Tax=Symbiodinium microadriaticum TaxID=2951 RepID=A0A1Q9EIE0_SYMMI|nr:hypothetical protein AK812_SmicGene9420 [Symbiodinium microadriaticum]